MMQPRLGTPSTVSTNRLLSPAIRSAVNSELNTTTLRTPLRRGFGHGPRQRGLPRRPSTSAELTDIALRWCPVCARDACDRFLPSTASISSTRASFALDEIASRVHGLFRIPQPPPALEELPPVGRSIEHPVFSRHRGGSGGLTLGVCFSPERGGVFFLRVRRQSNQ